MSNGPRRSATREISTDVVRIMCELTELVKDHNFEEPTPSLLERLSERVREERLVERAVLINFLAMHLEDTEGVRDLLGKAFGGEHRRTPALNGEA